LLWVWLLCFAAVTLLASSLGNSMGAGAGLALVGAVVILLLGALPLIGAISPAGLVSWASQLGLETAVPANAGALAFSLTLIVLLLVTTLAVFEEQEL